MRITLARSCWFAGYLARGSNRNSARGAIAATSDFVALSWLMELLAASDRTTSAISLKFSWAIAIAAKATCIGGKLGLKAAFSMYDPRYTFPRRERTATPEGEWVYGA